ncbi:MAG: hypothetical protein MJD61_08760 [Proteobacteria bacterium]|nr:hypothetical protein [Pseudomonadota bacterium]
MTWSYELVTGCQTNAHPEVAFARSEGGSSSTVHVMTQHECLTSNKGGKGLCPVSWRSTDAGANWSGVFVGEGNTFNGPLIPVYWGDYDGIVADGDTMFYFWGDMDAPLYRVRGQGIEP